MAYDYIKRAYGTEFKPGMRILFTEYNNKPGVVKHTRSDPQYVSVRFDDGREGDCHPSSLVIEDNNSPKQEGK